MNQLCKVCGEPAAGYHFGAFTCEGCKSFFGRTYNNLSALGECKNNGQCIINKKNRTSCKSCRLKKCLVVGMSKSGSRYGRRSNWFKIHCLIQDQAEMNSRLAEQGALNSSNNNNSSNGEGKDLDKQYKSENVRDTNSVSSAHNGISSNGASPTSSENSRALHSPYSALFEAAKANGFTSRFDSSSLSPHIDRKEQLASSHFHPYNSNNNINNNNSSSNNHHNAHHHHNHHHHHHHNLSSTGGGLPLSPVSPLSPLNPATRFFFHSAASFFNKSLNGVQKFYNSHGDLSSPFSIAYPSRYLPLQPLHPVLKTLNKDILNNNNTYSSSNNNNNNNNTKTIINEQEEFEGDVPEQEKPIDLTVRKRTRNETNLLSPNLKSLKYIENDGDDDDERADQDLNGNENENSRYVSPLDLSRREDNNNHCVKRKFEKDCGKDNLNSIKKEHFEVAEAK